ncbi:SRPBCC family protein [Nocardioides pelophilus]|uniref:SRPBCC family protein n=1 Tax=Nocardioides pelophilus TaxID=2172019 RepID=UPI001602B17E|nr:SRPBCC family protein [Nocardioides pelophilus]
MTSTTQGEAVRLDVTVEVSAERAFRVFTEQFDQIKPREHNLLAPEAIVDTVFETHVGGHVYDRGEDGSVCRWARVLAFDPPRRFVISWDISPTWELVTDLSEASEVEVTFVPEGPDRTRVELEHRHLERHGGGWESLREDVAGEGGWPLYLQRYAGTVAS